MKFEPFKEITLRPAGSQEHSLRLDVGVHVVRVLRRVRNIVVRHEIDLIAG